MPELSREQWLEERRKGIGGTDSPAIMGLSEWKGPYEVYLEKLGIVKKPIDNPYTQIGRALEPLVAELFQTRFECKLVKGEFFKSAEIPWLFASPDFIYDGLPIGMDCKVVISPYVLHKWGESDSDKIPLDYWGQGQHYMRAKGYNEWHFGALMPDGRVHRFILKADKTYQAMMVDMCGEFWEKHVLKGIEPTPTPSRMVSEYLIARYPKNKKEMLKTIDATTREVIDELASIRAKIAPLNTEKKACELFLKAVIGDADGIDLEEDGKITWKLTKASTKTSWQDVAKKIVTEFKLTDLQMIELQKIIDGCTVEKPGKRMFKFAVKGTDDEDDE